MHTNLQNPAALLAALAIVLTQSGCEAIGSIFKAGVWVGVIAVAAVVAIIGGIVAFAKR